MTSILDASLSSDSEDDVDYVPPSGAVSDSSGDEINDDDFSDTETKLKGGKTKISKKLEGKTENAVKTPEVIKKKADDIWNTFLSDVGMKPTTSQTKAVAIKEAAPKLDTPANEPSKNIETPANEPSKKLEDPIKSVFEFAGETFVVGDDRSVNGSHDGLLDKQNGEVPSNTKTVQPAKRGLDSVLGTILNKKQKVTTLQKSLYDWNTFKKSEGLEEELGTYNKGKGGFVERQRFLQRSDIRSFEKEKSLRLSKKQ